MFWPPVSFIRNKSIKAVLRNEDGVVAQCTLPNSFKITRHNAAMKAFPVRAHALETNGPLEPVPSSSQQRRACCPSSPPTNLNHPTSASAQAPGSMQSLRPMANSASSEAPIVPIISSSPYPAHPGVVSPNILAQAPRNETPPFALPMSRQGNEVERYIPLCTSPSVQQGFGYSNNRSLPSTSGPSENGCQPHSSNTAEPCPTFSSTVIGGANSGGLGSHRPDAMQRLSPPPPEVTQRPLCTSDADEPRQHAPYIEKVAPRKGPTTGGLEALVIGDHFPTGLIDLRFGEASARAVSNYRHSMPFPN